MDSTPPSEPARGPSSGETTEPQLQSCHAEILLVLRPRHAAAVGQEILRQLRQEEAMTASDRY